MHATAGMQQFCSKHSSPAVTVYSNLVYEKLLYVLYNRAV